MFPVPWCVILLLYTPLPWTIWTEFAEASLDSFLLGSEYLKELIWDLGGNKTHSFHDLIT